MFQLDWYGMHCRPAGRKNRQNTAIFTKISSLAPTLFPDQGPILYEIGYNQNLYFDRCIPSTLRCENKTNLTNFAIIGVGFCIHHVTDHNQIRHAYAYAYGLRFIRTVSVYSNAFMTKSLARNPPFKSVTKKKQTRNIELFSPRTQGNK